MGPSEPFWMPPRLLVDLTSPSPLASLLSSLAVLTLIALIFAAVRRPSEPRPNDDRKSLIAWLRELDRGVVERGSTVVGTCYYTAVERKWAVLQFFSLVAFFGVFVPWPGCLFALSIGLLGVFVVFRHWSIEENEVMYEVQTEDKVIDMEGTLNVPVVIACAFVFVYAPVAFAQMRLAGFGFDVDPSARPFAFALYTFFEILKIGPIVQYYDTFADRLHFEKLNEVTDHSIEAKCALLVFRASLDLIILAALKRFIDISRRTAGGLDLRPFEEDLKGNDEREKGLAIEWLQRFAVDGRPRAKVLLEDILSKADDRSFLPPEVQFSPESRFLAANALNLFGEKRSDKMMLKFVIDRYAEIARDWEQDNEKSANVLEKIGDAYHNYWKVDGVKARLAKSIEAYDRAIQKYTELQKGNEIKRAKEKREGIARIRNERLGIVKWFNPSRGFGFIQPESGGKDVFVHITAVERLGRRRLKEGQRIAFSIVRKQGKSSAENLRIMG